MKHHRHPPPRAIFPLAAALLWSTAAFAAPQGAPSGEPDSRQDALEDLPDRDEIAEHSSYDPGPELQATPGGGLIVNVFIMDGPVRVVIRDRESGEMLLERSGDSMFPFEVPRPELGVNAGRAAVEIYVKGELAHELELAR